VSWRTPDYEFDGELEELPGVLECLPSLLLCGLHLLGLSGLARALQAVGGRHDPREDVDREVAGGAAGRLLAHGSSRRLDEGTR